MIYKRMDTASNGKTEMENRGDEHEIKSQENQENEIFEMIEGFSLENLDTSLVDISESDNVPCGSLVMEKLVDIFSRETDIPNGRLFMEKLANVVCERYTISEILELFNPFETEKVWVAKIDDFLEGIEILEEFENYIVEMEKLRENVRKNLCMFMTYPHVLNLYRETCVYILTVFQYAKIERLNTIMFLEKQALETGEQSYFLSTYHRIIFTIFCVSLKTLLSQLPAFITRMGIKPVEWSNKEELFNNCNSTTKLDRGVWKEFNEYLKERGNVFDSAYESDRSMCIIS
jgi:hypothetical protein